jgi:polyisoprenoid-binding protein YceI
MAVGTTFAQKEVKYILDIKKSVIYWNGRKMMGSHQGTINFKSGTIVFKDKKLVSASFIVDMNSIKNTDIEDPEKNKNLVTHLKSDDFFNVEKFPEAQMVVTKIDRKPRDDYFLIGKLTIRGKSSDVKMPVTFAFNGDRLSSNITCAFDRSKHDVKFGSESFFAKIGDKIIYDDIDLNVFIEAEKD